VIAYDLQTPNDTREDYERVIARMKAYFTWCHLEKSVWRVDSAFNASEIREIVKSALHTGDRLFVARLQGNWANWTLGDERNSWLNARFF
jgi:hypothetical protein